MNVLLVRHAEAGDREAWEGDDRLRPLTKKGRRQADGIVEQLGGLEIRRIRSSPYVRCVETVQPLAVFLRLELEETPALAEGAGPGAVLEALDEGRGAVVLCTHGDVCWDVLEPLRRLGVVARDAEAKKGSTWMLEGSRGRVTAARYLPPPK